MARFYAIATVGETLITLLRREKSAATDPFIKTATIDHFRKPLPGERPLLALHLYRVAHTTRSRQPDRADGSKVVRPLHTVDLHYLWMVWAAPKEAQVLLGWTMRTLAEHAYILKATQLNRAVAEAFYDDETIEFVPDSVSLQDLTNIWEINKPDIQLSAAYVARAVTIHSDPVDGGPIVQAREPSFEPMPEEGGT